MTGPPASLGAGPSASLGTGPAALPFRVFLEVSAVLATSLAPISLLPDRSISLPLVLSSFQRESTQLRRFRRGAGRSFRLVPDIHRTRFLRPLPIWEKRRAPTSSSVTPEAAPPV